MNIPWPLNRRDHCCSRLLVAAEPSARRRTILSLAHMSDPSRFAQELHRSFAASENIFSWRPEIFVSSRSANVGCPSLRHAFLKSFLLTPEARPFHNSRRSFHHSRRSFHGDIAFATIMHNHQFIKCLGWERRWLECRWFGCRWLSTGMGSLNGPGSIA